MNLKEAEDILRAKLRHITCDYNKEDQAIDLVFNELKRLKGIEKLFNKSLPIIEMFAQWGGTGRDKEIGL